MAVDRAMSRQLYQQAAMRQPHDKVWPAWLAKYVGLPFRDKGRDAGGVDCWGLIYLIYRDEFRIEVPRYTERYASALERAEVSRLIQGESLGWRPVPLWEAALGDVLVLRVAGQPWHCALGIEWPWFLHSFKGTDSCIEAATHGLWAHRIEGTYRHQQRLRR
jgi:probable lipoprotein NlpC